MRKQVFGRQFKRDVNERKALFKGLLSSLVLAGRIQTTESKAKAVKGSADKLVTRVKKNATNMSSFLQKYLTPQAAEKIIVDITPRFSNRHGGYTRIIRIGRRLSDNAQMAVMEWVEGEEVEMREFSPRSAPRVDAGEAGKVQSERGKEKKEIKGREKKKKTKVGLTTTKRTSARTKTAQAKEGKEIKK